MGKFLRQIWLCRTMHSIRSLIKRKSPLFILFQNNNNNNNKVGMNDDENSIYILVINSLQL